MPAAKKFFSPLLKVLIFILATVWGAKVLYSEVIFPGYSFLPFEIYNPILDLTKDRFLFRIIFFLWTLFLYFFMQLILTKKKWKTLVIVQEKSKLISFLKGAVIGFIYMVGILSTLLILSFFKISKAYLVPKEVLILLFGYFIAVAATTFLLELIFRATSLEILKKHLNVHLANLIVSILFACIFIFSKSDFYPIKQLSLSLLLGYIYNRHGFYKAFGFHFGFDSLESLFFSNVVFNINLKRLADFTPLTELSLVSFIFLVAGILWIVFYSNKNIKKQHLT